MSSQVQPVGTLPNVYRLVSPTVVADATGGTTRVDANSKFNTNIPLDRYMLITEVDWFWGTVTQEAFGTTGTRNVWQRQGQLTEALARTAVQLTDPVYVDEDLWELFQQTIQSTAASITAFGIYGTWLHTRHVLANPWATAAQQLNLINSQVPQAVTVNGPKYNLNVVIEYQLLPLTADIRAYLAQRVQIAGQA